MNFIKIMVGNLVEEEHREYLNNFKSNFNSKPAFIKAEQSKSFLVKMFTRVPSSPSGTTSPNMKKMKPFKLAFPEKTSNILALEELEISRLKGIIQEMNKKPNLPQPILNKEKNIEMVECDYFKKPEGDFSSPSIVLDDIHLIKKTIGQKKWEYYFPSLELEQTEEMKIIISKSHAAESVKGLIELEKKF